ncbi:hypothetical protein K438DRAFT_1783075 [Mycena galopus ATCC 62051]|nr:hypothetical protein K438DRAFT_1783075 [Mycena galopus ATCC 62051]
MSSCSLSEQISVESALPLQKPAFAFAATTNESPSMRVHGDLCTCALETTEPVESRSVCRKDAQRRETLISHEPNQFSISSPSCSSGAHTTERAALGSEISAVVSAVPSHFSGEQMPVQPALLCDVVPETASNATLAVGERTAAVDREVQLQSRTSAVAPPKIVVASVTAPNATQRGRDHGYVRICALPKETRFWRTSCTYNGFIFSAMNVIFVCKMVTTDKWLTLTMLQNGRNWQMVHIDKVASGMGHISALRLQFPRSMVASSVLATS